MKIPVKTGKTSIEELLAAEGLLTKQKVLELQKRAAVGSKPIFQLLLDIGFTEDKLVALEAQYHGYEYIELKNYPIPSSGVWRHIKPAYAKKHKLLPLSYEENILTIATSEIGNNMAIEDLKNAYQSSDFHIKALKILITTNKQLMDAITKFYGVTESEEELEQSGKKHIQEEPVTTINLEEPSIDRDPIVMLTRKIVKEACQKRASDIHLEPATDHLRVRYRIDGQLIEEESVPKHMQDALISRYKIMASLRIDEKRVPQDGRIDFAEFDSETEIDLRVSTIPVLLGEDVVMRILEKNSPILSLDKLGFSEHNMNAYLSAISSPYGLVLHVGPTGSGKTTALYAALKSLDKNDTKILTAENPVEYVLGGKIMQSNINPAAGHTFAAALRAFLRHDPDILLIGEIRDAETAKIAVEASLTGHLVFSTLHTNDAVGTVTRLTEMGIESYLVADSLLLVCAQRLVRRICTNCKDVYVATQEEIDIAKGILEPTTMLYRGGGCKLCQGTGYRGRVGIYELLTINSMLRTLLIKGASTELLRRIAIESGMITLRQDALQKALAGIITFEGVIENTINK